MLSVLIVFPNFRLHGVDRDAAIGVLIVVPGECRRHRWIPRISQPTLTDARDI